MKWFSPIQKVPFYFPRWILWTLEDNLWWQNVVAHNATPRVELVDPTFAPKRVVYLRNVSSSKTKLQPWNL